MRSAIKQPLLNTSFLCFILGISLSIQIRAQKFSVDIIQLKNGNVIRGMIIEQPDTCIVKIETLCQNVLNFNINEVVSISTENIRPQSLKLFYQPVTKGFYNNTDFGLLIGTGDNDKNAIFSVSFINGYRSSPWLLTGGGIGVEMFEVLLLPLFADIKLQTSQTKLSPCLNFRIGYGFALEDPVSVWGENYDSSGGFLFSTGLGNIIRIGDSNAIMFSLMYRYQAIHTSRTYDWSDETTGLLKKYKRLELRLGFLFQ